MLAGCQCANCKRWVALPAPAPLDVFETEARWNLYAAERRERRAEHPIVPRVELV